MKSDDAELQRIRQEIHLIQQGKIVPVMKYVEHKLGGRQVVEIDALTGKPLEQAIEDLLKKENDG